MSKHIRKIPVNWIFYITIGLGLITLLVWSTLGEIARNPSRQAIANLGTYGQVTIQLKTNPYPARPTGTVQLNFIIMNTNRVIIEPDALTFEYGREGDNQIVNSGTAELTPDNSGSMLAGAQFPSVGKWWMRVTISKDGYQDMVQFTIDVRPAQ